MNSCGICSKTDRQLFETEKPGVYACYKCMPLMPEITISDQVEVIVEEADEEYENGSVSDQQLDCSLCNKTFQKSHQLQAHLRNHKAEKRFVCTYCSKAFTQSNNLRAHLRIHTNERPYKCTECGKAFTQVTNLNNHVRLHTGERPFACDEPGCDKAFAQVTNLNQHRKRHLSGRPMEQSYDCTICGEQFSQRNHMYMHRREQHAELSKPVQSRQQMKTYQCELCDLTLDSQKALRQHVEAHTITITEKPKTYSCVFKACGAVLNSAHEHTDHLLKAHQLRVLAAKSGSPPRRGRPPKVKHEVVSSSHSTYYEEEQEYETEELVEYEDEQEVDEEEHSEATMERWLGKTALVTGASAGIGAATCVGLANAGLKVIGLARTTHPIDNLKCKVTGPGCITSVNCDLTKHDDVAGAFKWAEDQGGVDLLVNNAGVLKKGHITGLGGCPLTDDDITSLIDVNLRSVVQCTRLAVDSMKRRGIQGHIVNINSIAGHYIPFAAEFNIYPATKHAVTAFTESLTHELAVLKSHIKTTSISPGFVATEMTKSAVDLVDFVPLKPEDVANAIIYVVSTPPTVNITELTIRPVAEKRL